MDVKDYYNIDSTRADREYARVALALDLMEEIDTLRERLCRFEANDST